MYYMGIKRENGAVGRLAAGSPGNLVLAPWAYDPLPPLCRGPLRDTGKPDSLDALRLEQQQSLQQASNSNAVIVRLSLAKLTYNRILRFLFLRKGEGEPHWNGYICKITGNVYHRIHQQQQQICSKRYGQNNREIFN